MTTVMLHSPMCPTAYLSAQTWFTCLRFSKLPMVHRGNRGKGTGSGQVRQSGYTNQKLEWKSTYRDMLAECAGMLASYIIHHSDTVYGGGSEIQRPWRFWMHMIIHRNDWLAVNNHYMIHIIQLLNIQCRLGCIQCKPQRSVNDFSSYTFSNHTCCIVPYCQRSTIGHHLS